MISLIEIFDMLIMTLFVGYIFSRFFQKEKGFHKKNIIQDIKWGAAMAAPAIVLHELAHKFVAMGFGAQATVHAPSLFGIPYGMYIFVIILSLLNFPVLFFVGGYVTHTPLPPFQSAMVSLAGPLTNLIIWQITSLLIKQNKIKSKHTKLAVLTREINKFLFIFNMIPIPGFDGFQFFLNIIKAI